MYICKNVEHTCTDNSTLLIHNNENIVNCSSYQNVSNIPESRFFKYFC